MLRETTKAKWNRNTENVSTVACRLRRTRTRTETRDKTTKMKLLDYTSELFYYVHKLVNRIAWPHNRDNMEPSTRFEECARSSSQWRRARDITFWHKLTFLTQCRRCSFMHGKRDACFFNWIHVWWILKSICYICHTHAQPYLYSRCPIKYLLSKWVRSHAIEHVAFALQHNVSRRQMIQGHFYWWPKR